MSTEMVLLDTCVLIDGLDRVTEPAAISVLSLVELRSGLGAATSPVVRAERQERYDAIVRRFEPLPLDEQVLGRYGRVDAAVRAMSRQPRTRMADLLIAATAAAYGVALLTDNLDDFAGLGGLVEVRRP